MCNLKIKVEGIQNLNMNPIALYHQMDAKNLIGLKTRLKYNVNNLKAEKYYDYEDTHVLKNLTPGDVIGLRTLLAENVDADGKVDHLKPCNLSPANFSVVSASANLKAFEIKIDDFYNLPYHLRMKMIKGARKFKDHDLEADQYLKEDWGYWDKFK